MKKILFIIIIFTLILSLNSCMKRPAKKYVGNLAQLDVIKEAIGENYTAMLITELYSTGKFDIIEDVLEDELMKERRKLGLKGPISADYLITGAITEYSVGDHTNSAGVILPGTAGGYNRNKIRARIAVDLRLIDIRTGSIVFASSGEGKNSAANTAVSGGKSLFTGISYSTETNDDKTLMDRAMRASVQKVVSKINIIGSSLGKSRIRVKIKPFKGPSQKKK